jgi:hypothetical protein
MSIAGLACAEFQSCHSTGPTPQVSEDLLAFDKRVENLISPEPECDRKAEDLLVITSRLLVAERYQR